MKKTILALFLALTMVACQESLEDRAYREAKEHTAKFCPQRLNENTTLDSLTFDITSHTFTSYLTIITDAEGAQRAQQLGSMIREELVMLVKSDTSRKIYKEEGYAFRYVARSDDNSLLYDTTITSDDYK